MKITIFNRTFSPGIPSTLFFLLMFPFMSSLGYWQYQRSIDKQEMLNAIDELADQPAIVIKQLQQLEKVKQYQPIELIAEPLLDKLIYIENRPHNGQVAADVLLPVLLEGKQIVLINLGWLYLPDRANLPQVSLLQKIKLDIILDKFPEAGWKLGSLEKPNTWPALLPRVEREKLEAWFGVKVFNKTGRLQYAIDEKLNTEWDPSVMPPSKHQGYSFQWFSMALALMILYISINITKVVKNES